MLLFSMEKTDFHFCHFPIFGYCQGHVTKAFFPRDEPPEFCWGDVLPLCILGSHNEHGWPQGISPKMNHFGCFHSFIIIPARAFFVTVEGEENEGSFASPHIVSTLFAQKKKKLFCNIYHSQTASKLTAEQGCLSASKPHVLIIQVCLNLFAIQIFHTPITNKV